MSKTTNRPRLPDHASSFLDSLRQFLTPAIWKEAEQARGCRRRSARWRTQPLILTLLLMTWCCGDSEAERFEAARAFTGVCLKKRRQPGKAVQGFQKALAKLPMRVLYVIAAGVRRRLLQLFNLDSDGFIVFGADGSNLECPRVVELEKRLDPPPKKRGAKNRAPQVWTTALVHLRTGLLWAWRLGKGKNRERSHLRALLPTLPPASLVVADAGYNGYDLAEAIMAAGVAFLIRMSAKDTLYSQLPFQGEDFQDGAVILWTQGARKKRRPPIPVRLIRIRGTQQRKDVWLLTNVLAVERLTVEMASRYYRWRWENEGLFRTYKRTLAKVKLMGRTVRQVHREAEGAMLATQLLLAQGTLALASKTGQVNARRCSPRKVLLAIREVIQGRTSGRRRDHFLSRLKKSLREDRQRITPKVKRAWPRRVEYKPPRPPNIRVLNEKEKALVAKLLTTAA